MAGLWDQVPGTSGGALDALEPLLSSVPGSTSSERSESDGVWKIWSDTLGGDQPMDLDLSTGAFTRGVGSGNGNDGMLELAGGLGVELGVHLDHSGGDPDGPVRLVLTVPSSSVRLPFLRGATLDAQGQLQPDPVHTAVKFLLPSLKVRLLKPASGGIQVDLLDSTTGTVNDDPVLNLVRMEPAYALVGPGNTVGFAFRAAVLDLSGTSGPTGVPAGAFTMPGEWQGLYLPEVRLFVAPQGLEGIAVSAGVKDLWIGFGRFAGVTGVFNAEVVNRGSAPSLRLRFQTPAGEWIGVPDTDPIGNVELPEKVTLFADGGGGIAPLTFTITVDGTPTTSDRVDVVVPAAGSVSVSVEARDGGAHTTTRTFTASRRAAAGVTDGTTQPVTPVTTSSTGFVVLVQPKTTTTVTASLSPDPGGTVAWTWTGQTTPVTGATADIPVAAGSPVDVTATITRTSATVTTIDAYTEFDHPSQAELAAGPSTPWPVTDGKQFDKPWADRHHPAPDAQALLGPDGLARLGAIPKATAFTVEGWASCEDPTDPTKVGYNKALSERRRDALVALLRSTSHPELGFTHVNPGTAHGQDDAKASLDPTSPRWWHAAATAHLDQTVTVTATLTRPADPPPPQHTDPRPTPPPTPDCFRKIGVTVELVRSTFVRAEIYGEFDIQTAAEQRISASTTATVPPRDNPSDGICQFLLRLKIAEDRSSWEVDAQFKAIDADKDGLWQKVSDGSDTGINILGALAVLSPLLATATPANPTAGELVPMALATGGVVAIGAAGVLKTRKLTLHGGQLVVTNGLVDPATGDGPRKTTISILLDVETSFTFDLSPLLKVDPAKPLTARYKAVGLRSQWRSDPQPDGTVQYVPLPVYDPSQGYSLDIPTGSLIGPDALKDVLRVLGGRISKDNPTYLEVEVGLGVDLGIVTVDTARIRVRLDQPEFPQLTALGAHVAIPDVLHGGGSVRILPDGFTGSFDLALDSLNLRISATLTVESKDGVTGVLVGAEVQFPAPILLGSSGLGIFGFLGGVAVNFQRDESPFAGQQVPALSWFKQQLQTPSGSLMDNTSNGWKLTPGAYAIAGGILLGTAEGGFIVHLKGLVLIEVPGPRLLFAMKADVLSLPPVLTDASSEATFLAVLDIDLGQGTITIGLVAEYTVPSLLHVSVPVTAFFDTNHVEEWLVDLGTYTAPVTVSVLDVFSGTGYLMIHGDGTTIHIPTLPLVTSGVTVAVGFHMQVVLMGSKSIGLYLEVAAGFDAVVSFSPFAIGGFIQVSGELRLWIVGISASASLTVLVGRQVLPNGDTVDRTYVHGEVCGEVDFFFFSVKGCVSLTIGDDTPIPLVPPPLVKGVSLVSRSPALVVGSAVDRAVDGVLASAVAVGDAGDLPSVPLDAIPVISFETAPLVAGGNVVLGGVANGSNGLPANPWVKHGDTWWRYRVTKVDLLGALQPPPPAGKTPATWWKRASSDPVAGPSLALLSWIPTATPRAVTLGKSLTTTVTETWGTICTPVAEPAPVLWTFDEQAVGPSPVGWVLTGVPWPDAPGTTRSQPADLRATVTEPWRTGDKLVDLLQGTDPAIVIGDAVRCGRDQTRVASLAAVTHAAGVAATGAAAAFGSMPSAGGSVQDAVDLIAAGSSLRDLPVAWAASAAGGATAGVPTCQGRILRSPVDDVPEPAPDGDPAEQELVKKAWSDLGFRPSELGSSVLLHADGGLASLDALLLVPRKAIERGLVVRFRSADGALLDEYRVRGSDLLSGTHTVPAHWVDASGPWLDPVLRAAQIGARVMAGGAGVTYVLVSPKVPDGTVDVEIGWDRTIEWLQGEAFWVVAVGATTAAEVQRHDWDTTTTSTDTDSATNAVEQDPDDHALLVPGQTYTVHVEWEAQQLTQDAQPAASYPDGYTAGTPQEFRFVADDQSKAPATLDPWLLSTAPAVGEVGFLLGEPLQVALATQKVTDLFDAYGLEVRIVVRSASGRHPSPPGGGAPGSAVTVPVGISGVLQAAHTGLRVMTPWQQTLTALLDELPCVDASGSKTYHSVITLDYPLEPLTDYILDVYAVPKGSPADATGTRLHRVNFTTSRFSTVTELADLTRLTLVRDALVPTPAGLATLTDRPTGDQLDAAFQAAGLPVPQVPRYPAVTVLWSPDAVPQPVAVVVEGGEAFWRARPVPTFLTGLVVDDPTQGWWVAQDTDWLSLQTSASAPEAGDPPRAPVTRLVRGPGDTRAVVLLGPSARGTELVLDLVRAADPLSGGTATTATAVRVFFGSAPWEVAD